MKQNPSERLVEIAFRFCESAKNKSAYDDVRAWAITGSAARQNASLASDLELWALTDEAKRPQHLVFEGTPITIFYESEALLFDPTYLVTVEAEHMMIVRDKEGVLAEVKEFAQQLVPKFRLFAEQNARKTIERSGVFASANTLAARLLQQDKSHALLLLAALKKGERRVLKAREFSAAFGADIVALLNASLSLSESHTLSLVSLIEAHWRSLNELSLEKRGMRFERPLAQRSMMRKAQANECADALLAARTFLRRHFLHRERNVSAFFESLSDDNQHFFRVVFTGSLSDNFAQAHKKSAHANERLVRLLKA